MSQFRVKVVRPDVRRITFLWGGAGVGVELMSDLVLTFRVPNDGEPIVFGLIKSNPRREIRLGRLEVGEAFTLPLNGLSGVYAVGVDGGHDTYIDCELIQGADSTTTPRLRGVPGL